MHSKRENNYELLRVISMISVIIIHVSATWINGYSEYISSGGNLNRLIHPLLPCIYNSISRFAVPCFVMLTGAFLLSDSKNANYREFYKKKFLKIGLPTLIFSVLYVLYRFVICLIKTEPGGYLGIIKDAIRGAPYSHMWYLYMLIGLYLLTPVVVRFKESVSYQNFRKIAFIFIILACLSNWTTGEIRVNWNIGQSFEYLGYFMVGYVLRKDISKNKTRGLWLVIIGLSCEIVLALVEYKVQIVGGITNPPFSIVKPYSPGVVIASLSIFAGFTMLTMEENVIVLKLSKLSFLIYLIHAGVWDLVSKLTEFLSGEKHIYETINPLYIPLFVLIVLVASIVLAKAYERIEHWIKYKYIRFINR